MMTIKEYYGKEMSERKKFREITRFYKELKENENTSAEKIETLMAMLEYYRKNFLWGCAKIRQKRNVSGTIKMLKKFGDGQHIKFMIDHIGEDEGNVFSFSSACGFRNHGGTYSEKIVSLMAEKKLGKRNKFAFNIITDADKNGRPIVKFEKLTCDCCMLLATYRRCPGNPKECCGYGGKYKKLIERG